jgi:2,4-dienoyl-CoA reductase-like NADH-dependent reductase (Old Yellow Enzyme family)
LAAAGVDIFHCSQRRFWEPEFDGSDLNLAGWTKKLTGKPTITVGSVSLGTEMIATVLGGERAAVTSLGDLIERIERQEFDMVAIGRALIANPDWPHLIAAGRGADLTSFGGDLLASLH